MLFNSLSFLVFFPIFLVFYRASHGRTRLLITLLASNYFYACWNWQLLPLLWFQTTLDFFIGRALGYEPDPTRRKRLLVVSLSANLLLLGFFKYFHFALDSLGAALGLVGVHLPEVRLDIVLPVGISFYTFQSMSYVIDVYRREIEPEARFLPFATAIALFAHLVAGPIVRARRLLPQMRSDRPFDVAEITAGFEQALWGFFKKVAIADSLAPLVDQSFQNPSVQGGMTLLLALLFYSVQIYCDFSGYTDIALGCAHILGFDLGLNFDRPYFSRGFSEFWTRWHVSLSRWLRDYLYIGLGGNRRGRLRTYVNLMLTMLIGGLWHGANWTFVVWGGLHGLYLVAERAARPTLDRAVATLRVPRPVTVLVAGVLVFSAVTFAWIFFRSRDFATATAMIEGIATRTQPTLAQVQHKFLVYKALGLVGFLFAVEALSFHPTLFERLRAHASIRYVSAAALLLGIALFGTFSGAAFIYFQF